MLRKTFQAAWVVCGYMDWHHMSIYDPELHTQKALDLHDAQAVLSDVFKQCGAGSFSPQRCRMFEWQIQVGENQDMGEIELPC